MKCDVIASFTHPKSLLTKLARQYVPHSIVVTREKIECIFPSSVIRLIVHKHLWRILTQFRVQQD